MIKHSGEIHRVRGVATFLLLVLLVATATSLAQDEDFDSQPPLIDQTPVVLSQTVMPNAVNTVVEIPIAQDTYITSNQPSTNWCTSNWLRLGYSKDPPNYGAVRMFLKFNLSSIPSDAAINRALFRIYLHTVTPPGDGSMRAESRHLASDWNQCLVTWNSHQPQWGPVFGSSWIPSTLGWLEADATELVKDWVYGNHPNYGAMIMGDETVRERQRFFFSSRDTGGRYPRLIVDYTLNVDPQPPQVSVNPLPQWSVQRFIVSWSGTDPGGSGIDYYDVQYGVPGEAWIQWLYHTRETWSEFRGGANGVTYEFRARGVDKAGNVQAWSPTAQASTTVDAIPPTASVLPLDPLTFAPAFTVDWSGSDNPGGSGLRSFDVEYQADGGAWQDWFVGTTAVSGPFTGGQNGVKYGFRTRAIDVAGNVQPWSAAAQAFTTVDTQGPVASILPFDAPITGADQFLVRWMGESSPNTSIVSYDIRYNFRNGPWSPWFSQTQLVQTMFTDLRTEDGVYCFEVRTRDSAGRASDYMGQRCIVVDRYPPFVEVRAYLPIVAKDSP